MTVHSLFKKAVSESALSALFAEKSATNVNEGIEDSAVGWLTRNNILPQLFSGNRNGLRIPPALKSGKLPPDWSREYLTYPFVGINGYSNEPAMEAKHGNVASYVGDTLKRFGSSGEVREILQKQVSEGTGIPGNVFLFYPQMPITSVGTKGSRKSMSLFSPYNKRDAYSNSIYPYNVQQALSVDADGNLRPNPEKKGGVVLCPVARKAQMASGGLMYADRLDADDLVQVVNRMSLSRLAEEVTGDLTLPKPGGMLLSYMTGARPATLPGGNPDYMDFGKFAEENGFMDGNGGIDFAAMRKWIVESSVYDVVDGLVIPYLLMSPIGSTYCWKALPRGLESRFSDEIAVFNALSRGGRSVEGALANAESGFDIDDGAGDVGESFDIPFFGEDGEEIVESSGGFEISGELGAEEMMAICSRYCRTHASTFMMLPSERSTPLLRDDGKIKTKSSGVKRTFARIITENTPLIDTDYRFCPRGAEGLETSHSGVLDYSPLFDAYPDIVDASKPTKLPYTRIVGYMVSFEYDPEIEAEYEKKVRKGKVRNLGMLNYYTESPNSRMFREPTIFDVLYIRDGGNGFIFSGYASNGKSGGGAPPAEISAAMEANGLLASSSGMHSAAVHGSSHAKVSYGYNTNVY